MRGAARPAPSGRRRPPGPFRTRISRCGGMAGPKGERCLPLRRPLAPGRRPEPPSSHPRRFPGERREGGGGSRLGAAVVAGVGRASRRGHSRTAASPPRAQRVSFAPAPTGPCGRAACAKGRARRGEPAWSLPGCPAGPDGRLGPFGVAGGANPWPIAPGTSLTFHASRVLSR